MPRAAGNTLGQRWHDVVVDALTELFRQVTCEAPRVPEDLMQTPVRRQSVGGVEQPQVGKLLIRQQQRLAFDIGLGAAAPADARVGSGRV